MRGVGGRTREGEYERYRAVVLGMLAKRFPRLDDDERLSIYHDAWTRVLVKRERGERIGSLRAYLLATSGAEALHSLSRGRAPTPVGPDDPRLAALQDDAPPLDEQVVTRDQARIARGLLDTLDERQRDVLKLRWDLQLSASEVRAALGLSERQYRRLAEEGAEVLAARVEELDSGEWSRRTRSLLVACLVEVTRDGERRVGIATVRQREEAQRLLESDPHVAALYAEVRRSVRGAAALLPLPAFFAVPGSAADTREPASELPAHAVEAAPGVGDHAGGVVDTREPANELPAHAVQAAPGVGDHAGGVVSGLRDQLAGALDAVRQHATSVYLRAADPSLMAGGPRPGTALVAVAGLLAAGGGAYGAYETVKPQAPPPAAASSPAPTSHHQPPVATPPHPPATPQPKPKKPNTKKKPNPTPKPEPTPTPTSSPAPNPTPQPPPTPPTQPTEFGFED